MWRKIWEDHYGKIPVDEDGRTYEIHHSDGDRTNNDISNLQCVSINEHYDIHMSRGDFKAASLIAWRMNNPEKYKAAKAGLSKKNSEFQKNLVNKNMHHLQSGDIQRKTNLRRLEEGTHLFLDREWHSRKNKIQVDNETHCLLRQKDGTSIGGESSKNRVLMGTHHFQNSELQRKLSERAKKVCSKKVLRTCLRTNETKVYDSVSEVLTENPDYKVTIYRKIANEKEYKGYHWKYL